MKQFKTESKKVMDLMINSIYTNKEIFLRELISNASDAIDKLYYESLKNGNTGLSRNDFSIHISTDKENRTLTISDNGIGMNDVDLEKNLGTIAKSGSQDFKNNAKDLNDIDIIGQFGVGFYSAFMVVDKVEVISKPFGSDKAYKWVSSGVEGFEITETEKNSFGTDVILHLKKDTDDENYSKYLEEYEIRSLVKKYSDYVRYPITIDVEKTEKTDDGKEVKKVELETLNSMLPLWKRNKSELKEEDYNHLCSDLFYDSEKPFDYLHLNLEGAVNYKAILFIPSRIPYNYYSKEYEKGLKLYTNGVLITEKCSELLPDYFNFVKGVVDADLQLNISRETLQHSRQITVIANSIENKIKDELLKIQKNDREKYVEFFKNFGTQIKYGIYQVWGMNKEKLQDLLVFESVKTEKYITLKEYSETKLNDQKEIYYVNAKNIKSAKNIPQVKQTIEKGEDVLILSEDIDEFVVKVMREYNGLQLKSVLDSDFSLNDYKANDDENKIIEKVKGVLKDEIENVVLTNDLSDISSSILTVGEISLEMEKVINSNPINQKVKAKKVLQINVNSNEYKALKSSFENEDEEKFNNISKLLMYEAFIVADIKIEKPDEFVKLISQNF